MIKTYPDGLVFVVSKIVTDKTSIKKPSDNRELIQRLYENFSETKNLPEGRWSGLFYLTVLGTVTEDNTLVYRGRVTKVKKLSEYQRAQVLLDKTFID